MRQLATNSLYDVGVTVAGVSTPGQPYRLDFLQAVASVARDPDLHLIQLLQHGVPTGTDKPISRSGIWRPCSFEQANEDLELICCDKNWASAQKNEGWSMNY